MILRQLRDSHADAEAVREIALAAFGNLASGDGGPQHLPTEAQDVFHRARTRHLAAADPGGCWLAVAEDRPVGFALSARREGVWILSLTAVLPEYQGRGVGRLLLERAAEHGRGCLRGMITVSVDPAAARRYRRAGFQLHPTMRLSGEVDRAGLPPAAELPVLRGTAKHLELLDSIDRRVRDAAHGVDHQLMLAHYEELLVCDTMAGTGYCYRDGGTVKLLAATSRRLAARLLLEALARVPVGTPAKVEWLTADQEWAVDVGLDLGLTLENRGYLALRGMKPPPAYLPSGGFL
ncbi:GNAT family N-acetyltransferase [Kitasatospora viridis]|uniref:Ribosomal protein S18 acetylase RimI-like enzyme n=1 Tax=Kitasatospora viridis TaxID=281105 RepID=A0A561UM07_9ACTN|nr:GNAT family N-acetyltransferase [Kitasatospora viridis]TWG00392.1 ribosomal protein S18 acetylase RimI-like enzyme [Kitasatospora viridis]